MKSLLTRIMVFSLLFTGAIGCTSISTGQRAQLLELLECGIDQDEQGSTIPAVAGVLNFLIPGVGNFYIGAAGSNSDQMMVGGLNFLSNILWPLSVLWATPEAIIDANNVNKIQTLEYYTYTRHGKKELEKRCTDLGAELPTANRK